MNPSPASPHPLALLGPLGATSKTTSRRAALALASAARIDPRVRDELRAGLASDDQHARFACAFSLALAGASAHEPRLLNALCDALDAADSDRRWAAAAALARLGGNPRARARLARLVRAGTPRARRMALYCLRELAGPHDCRLGADAARDGDTQVRLAALAMIAERAGGCARCAASALGRLEHDNAAGVRRAAAAALGKLEVRSPAILHALRRSAALSDSGLARAARGALESLARAQPQLSRGA
jgi:hypothetical protein